MEPIVLQDKRGNYCYFDNVDLMQQLLGEPAKILGFNMKTLITIRSEFRKLGCNMPITLKDVKEQFEHLKKRRATLRDALKRLRVVNKLASDRWLDDDVTDDNDAFLLDNYRFMLKEDDEKEEADEEN